MIPTNHGKVWSFEEIKSLCDLYESGVRWGAIAEALGRSVPACVLKLRAVRMFANFPADLWRPRPLYQLKTLDHKNR